MNPPAASAITSSKMPITQPAPAGRADGHATWYEGQHPSVRHKLGPHDIVAGHVLAGRPIVPRHASSVWERKRTLAGEAAQRAATRTEGDQALADQAVVAADDAESKARDRFHAAEKDGFLKDRP